ncbi:aldehyde dehydrogenase (NADP(+)) [Microbacterium oleivorans]|uniref:Aldehyde dehydrogenase (NADP(+)) n=1 Tax=Microbacterium oleivorans TaxID=273677 RepID=A0A4R5YN27_9MICO|nr:aldehyde dehydrogenase (NADP(+)) [Microbacterium oleivorans]TDL46032.1 aldehyde dehydrogenase (NADP(+)) [Microbacterium oleivorans]
MERTLSIHSIIAGAPVAGSGEEISAVAAFDGAPLEPAYRATSPEEFERAASAAADAFDVYRATDHETRAAFLERIADAIEARGAEITERGVVETGLPAARLENERGRTTGQLRLFAAVLREGSWAGARIDRALPDRAPAPRPDLRRRLVPLGPVAVFGASNFPLAFSTAGGDTASALAAGCPVIVKAHQGHPGVASLIGDAIAEAVEASGLPGGVFSQVFGSGRDIGQRLVADPRIGAVGFTGSRAGGLSLVRTAQQRPVPIPVYAEMSSINPVVVLPAAVEADGGAIAAGYVDSLTLGSGQFCTNPGILVVPRSAAGDELLGRVAELVRGRTGQTMLTPGIHSAFREGVDARRSADTAIVGEGAPGEGPHAPAPIVFEADAASFGDALADEVFGAAGLVLRYDSAEQLHGLVAGLEGQLTATVFAAEADHEVARGLLPVLERRVGRILFNGWPTGVEVTWTMVHGGPFPATSDSRSTSVGAAAIERFLRPVAYQNVPAGLLPEVVRDDNPWGVPQRVDGGIVLP